MTHYVCPNCGKPDGKKYDDFLSVNIKEGILRFCEFCKHTWREQFAPVG